MMWTTFAVVANLAVIISITNAASFDFYYYNIDLGQQAIMTCTIDKANTFDGLYDPTGKKLTNEGRFSVLENVGEGKYELRIKDVATEDHGKYTCKVKDGKEADGVTTLNIAVSVENLKDKYYLAIGDTGTVKLNVAGYPRPPSITWGKKVDQDDTILVVLKDGVLSKQSPRFSIDPDGSLKIEQVEQNDAGSYYIAVLKPGGLITKRTQILTGVKPTFLVAPPAKFSVSVGQTITVKCKRDGDKWPKWQYNSTDGVISELVSVSPRIEVLKDSVVIKNAARSDEGTYLCSATNDYGTTVLKSVLEHVITPAKVNAILDQTIGLGEPFALKCSATGYPLPKVEWQILKDGKFVKLTSQVYNGTAESVYKVSTASTTDRGKYKCVADNGATKDNKPAPDSKEIEVLIYTKPSITSATDEVKFILGKGEKKTIACVAEGFPAPKITFSKDGKNITTGVNKTTDKQSVTGTLVYTVTKKEDFGEIVCTAKNERGEQTRTIKVSEIKKPGMPTELEAVLVDVTEVTIAWKAPIKTGEEKITLYEITIAPVNGTASTEKTTGTRVKLDGLKRKTKYSISVRAKNVAGLGKPSTINVVTEEFALPGSPTVDKFSKDIPPHEIPISWSKPTEDGGSPSLTYKVAVCVYDQVKKTPSDCYTINAGSNTSVIIKNVKPDTYYSITVNAVNSRGRGKSVSVVTRTGKSMATPKPAPKEPRKEERGLGGGAIAGIVIAVILIVLIVVDLFCCFFNNCGFTHCCYETFCAGKAGKAAKYEAAKSEEKQELKEKDNAPAENV